MSTLGMTDHQEIGDAKIVVSLGRPTIVHQLFYEKMYDPKPFEDAALYYYDNGIYKIISPGEEHYGLYVVNGRIEGDVFEIDYIAFPSKDWGGKTALHHLRFDRKAATFKQQATWEGDLNMPAQLGRFAERRNDHADSESIRWATHGRACLACR